jgi:hypothetical protein
MTDARFPERWLNDARLQRVSASAYRLFGNGLMWTVANRTDGHIPVWALAMIPHASEPDAKELAAAGLWPEHERDGWSVVDFGDTQTARSDLELLDNSRRQDAVKKRRQRHHAAGDHSLCYPEVCPLSPGQSPGTSPRDPTRTGKGALTGPRTEVAGRRACAEPGCPRPSRNGCRTCWDHAHLEAAL